MRVRTQNYNEVTVVEIQGEFDLEYMDLFQNTVYGVIAEDKSGIVLDLSSVTFIDSVGLEQLLWARDYCNENNCQLKLAGLDENCSKILEVTQLENKFDRYLELAEAVKSFA